MNIVKRIYDYAVILSRKSMVHVVFLLLLATALRVRAYTQSSPLWVDEYSTARQAIVWMDTFGFSKLLSHNPLLILEPNNILTHIITATMFLVGGINEHMLRLPSLIAGILVVPLIYWLGLITYSKRAGFIAALFTATAYIQIAWSLQGRGYMMQQVWILITLLIILLLKRAKGTQLTWITLLIVTFLGITTHYMYFLMCLVVLSELTPTFSKRFVNSHRILLCCALTFIAIVLYGSGFYPYFLNGIKSGFFFGVNNLWYYHAFLWREYSLVTYVALLGYIISALHHRRSISPLITYIALVLIFVCFVFKPYASKYVLTIFPLIFLGAGIFLSELGKLISNPRWALTFSIFMGIFIIANGHKFVIKPKLYYSLNHDFREIANIDYDKMYDLINGRIQGNPDKKVALVETWHERGQWYLGYSYEPLYYWRWQNEQGSTNGITKETAYKVDNNGDKYVLNVMPFIGTLADLKKVQKKYNYGFIFIDDDTYPKEIIEHAKTTMKKELYLDQYPLEDNPYSKWPATLYSWGFE